MTDHQKREAVAKAYPGDGWAKKVQKMGDHQIHVIYMRLVNAKKL
ncbi:hypothetical protein SEA_TOKKI_56 [Arthrobacter phage Tokki]|nr:hypothetical protein PBI_SHEPARD_54 [Arthrobacter phage Shepard]UGL63281.1 hypothetical protein SEA_TOKKI_56 [Arthrobacter phage Tokki]UYL88246.1 hypothetical protein SEA_LILHUDDY_53 [Arthrobacter phage LilHuddy]